MSVIRETYPATVTVNDDDEQRGRIRVACAGLMGDEESDLPMWVEPALDWGWFYIPDVGEIVEIEFTTSSEEDEHFGQASIDNPDVRWKGKRFYTTGEGTVGEQDQDPEKDARLVHSEFKTNYGKRRGFATPWGHVIIFDDTDGDHRISISHSAEQLPHGEAFADETKYTRIEIEPDGSIKAQLIGKHSLHFQTVANKLELLMDIQNGTEQHKIEYDANVPHLKVEMDTAQQVVTLDGSIPKLEASLASGVHVMKLDGSIPEMKATLASEAQSLHLDGATPKLEVLLASANSGMTLDDSTSSLKAFVDGGDNSVELDGTTPSLNVGLGGGAGALIDQADDSTVTTLGDGAVSAVIAENLQAWLNDTYTPAIADMHDNHYHPFPEYLIPLVPISQGPTLPGTSPFTNGLPVVPALLEQYDTGITSTHLVFPDG